MVSVQHRTTSHPKYPSYHNRLGVRRLILSFFLYIPHSFTLLPANPPPASLTTSQKLYKQIDWSKFKSEDDEEEEE